MGWPPGPSVTSVPHPQDGTYNQQAEVVVQMPYLEASEGAAFPLQEVAEDGGQGEPRSPSACWGTRGAGGLVCCRPTVPGAPSAGSVLQMARLSTTSSICGSQVGVASLWQSPVC